MAGFKGEMLMAVVIVIRRLVIARNFIILQYSPSVMMSRVWMEYNGAYLRRGERIGVVQAAPRLSFFIVLIRTP